MKQQLIISLIFAFLVGAYHTLSVLGQTGIGVSNADATFQPNLSSSTTLDGFLGSATTRVASEFSDALRLATLSRPDSTMQSILGAVAQRLGFDFAQANRMTNLQFPKTLVNDTIPPQVQGEISAQSGSGSVTLSWATAEFTIATVRYGTQSGNYPNTQSVTSFAKQHRLPLPDLATGATIFYQITLTDLSDNQFTTAEQSFTLSATQSVYLPVVSR